MDEAVQEGSRGDDDGTGGDVAAIAEGNAAGGAWSFKFQVSSFECRYLGFVFQDQPGDFGLLDLQIRLRFQHLPHLEAVSLLVALRSRRPDGWTSGRIEQSELNPYRVRDFSHDAAESIDFANEMSLGNSANRWIAGHLRDQIDVQRVEGSLQAHPRARQRRLATGVAGSDYDDVEMLCEGGHGNAGVPILTSEVEAPFPRGTLSTRHPL